MDKQVSVERQQSRSQRMYLSVALVKGRGISFAPVLFRVDEALDAR